MARFNVGDIVYSAYTQRHFLIENISVNRWGELFYSYRILEDGEVHDVITTNMDYDGAFVGAA